MTAVEFIQEKAKSKNVRWIILLLVSFTIATNYYVYDVMSGIKSILQSQLGFSNSEYGILVSLYSIPNLFFTIIGGIILDKWGIRKTGYLFVGLCVLGIFLSAYGVSPYFRNGGFGFGFLNMFLHNTTPEVKILMFGRLLFGLGAETSIVIVNKVIAKWFKGKEMGIAFSINIAIARIGTAAALIVSPLLSEGSDFWYYALWISALLMLMGFVTFVIYTFYDKRMSPKNDTSAKLTAEEEFHFKDILALLNNKSFIYISLLCVTFYSAVFPFQAFCADFLHFKFEVSVTASGLLSSLIILGTIVFTPIFGIVVDIFGKRLTLMFWGSALLFLSHIILGLTHLTPYIPLVTLGIAFSLVPAAMWPCIPMIVEENKLGTAYGVMGAIQSLGMAGVPILSGKILDLLNPNVKIEEGVFNSSLDYTWVMMLYAGLSLLGFVFAILLKRADKAVKGYGLELPSIR